MPGSEGEAAAMLDEYLARSKARAAGAEVPAAVFIAWDPTTRAHGRSLFGACRAGGLGRRGRTAWLRGLQRRGRREISASPPAVWTPGATEGHRAVRVAGTETRDAARIPRGSHAWEEGMASRTQVRAGASVSARYAPGLTIMTVRVEPG
jgi:hypothetical protein